MSLPEPAPSLRPSRVRYGVLGFACTLSMVTYLDRVCFSSGLGWIKDDLGLQSEADLRGALTAFALAYSLFEVPSGWLGDVFGPRRVLIRIVLWWSAFTALTGLVGLWAWQGWTISLFGSHVIGWMAVLVLIRFLFGMGEAGAYPNITRALHNWFPYAQRGFAQGCVWMSGRLMGGLTSLIWALLIAGLSITVTDPDTGQSAEQLLVSPLFSSWRHAFWFFGAVGVVWCVLFAWWFRNRPEEKPSVNAAELALIRADGYTTQAAHKGVPWGRILRSPDLWLLCGMYACQSYGWYFFITYLPVCLEEQCHVASTSFLGAVYKGGPLWMGAIGCLLGGYLTDWYIRRTGDRRRGRKLFGVIGHSSAGVFFLLASLALMAPPSVAALLFFLTISLAGFSFDMTMGASWATCQDIGRRYAAICAGFMNMMGNLGGAVATYLSGYVVALTLDHHAASLGRTVEQLSDAEKIAGKLPGYHLNLLIFAAVCAVGAVCWSLVDATRPVVPEDEMRVES